MTVLVVGATGTVGPHVLTALATLGVPAWVLTHGADRARAILPAGTDIRSGDPGDDDDLLAPAGAPATYLLHFGENYRHFHALVAARGADIPLAQRGGSILGLRPGHVDRDAQVS
jgi:uncharacterized protein YbjT (DUF2867 family)